MRKFFVTVVVVGIFLLYGLYQKLALTPVGAATAGTTPLNSSNNNNSGTTTTTPPVTASNSSTNNNITPSTTPNSNTGTYKNGTYTGSVADAFYGSVQVQATISGGQLTNVTFLQFPSDRRNSQMINNQAMPMLSSEAIQAQSANVNVVSGATDTSMAFMQSLSSALQSALN